MFPFYVTLLLLLGCITRSVRAMKVYLVHVDDGVRKWKISNDRLVDLDSMSKFMSILQTELWDQGSGREIYRLELFDATSGIYQELTEGLLQISLHTPKPEHLLVHTSLPGSRSDEPLRIAGRHFDLADGFSISQGRIVIQEQEKAELGTGLISWDGSVVLAKYLEKHPTLVKNKKIVELGAGTGVSGLTCWLLGAEKVVLTDLPYTMGNLQHNVQSTLDANKHLLGNMAGEISVQMLDWQDSGSYPVDEYDIVVGADIVWLEQLVAPLVSTIQHFLASPERRVSMLLAHQTRSVHTDEMLFQHLAKAMLAVNEVPRDELASDFQTEKIRIFRITSLARNSREEHSDLL